MEFTKTMVARADADKIFKNVLLITNLEGQLDEQSLIIICQTHQKDLRKNIDKPISRIYTPYALSFV